ncbi:MAG: flagellar biosynthetic protein FliQ [Rhodobacteraceae bacterium]|nr:flagellar biosynthetic protein FliQ [Paracoccaceae bacterium]
MTEGMFFDAMREGLWAGVAMATPILAVALTTGLVIGLFQALTSIQEMTLTFVPKLIAMAIAFWMSMSFMTRTIVSFFHGQVLPLIVGGA